MNKNELIEKAKGAYTEYREAFKLEHPKHSAPPSWEQAGNLIRETWAERMRAELFPAPVAPPLPPAAEIEPPAYRQPPQHRKGARR